MAEEEEEKEKGGSSKLIIIIGAVVALAGGGAFFMLSGGDDKGKEADKIEVVTPDLSKLEEDITISFQGQDQSHYLLVKFSYQTKTKATKEYLDKKAPLVRQIINTYLLSLEATEIKGKTGITKVKNKIMSVLSKVVEKGKLPESAGIEDVYIEKYIVQ